MKLFQCPNCKHPVYFENVVCEKCKSWLGFHEGKSSMVALAPAGSIWNFNFESGREYKYCDNHQHKVCNWMIPVDKESGLCTACDVNNTVPNVADPVHLVEWRRLEEAKHRLIYALLRLGLPVEPKTDEHPEGLLFDFLVPLDPKKPVMTGHDEGLITLNTLEADPVKREATRVQMNERYRTLIGHFRHEVGHYYWNLLIREDPKALKAFRKLFGDDRKDYGEALQAHYKNGSPEDWEQHFISKYASSHPWEDWAETWAHYLHLMDMMETAWSFGLEVAPAVDRNDMMHVAANFDPYEQVDIEKILQEAVPVTFAVNSLNRGMGREDLYPFTFNDEVRKKLAYVHDLVRKAGRA